MTSGSSVMIARPIASPFSAIPGPEEEVTPSLTTLQAWRWAKLTLPPLITGASLADGEAEPGSALFNMLAIRVPFLLGCVVLLTNVLLGGGVRVGEVAWPPVDPPPPSWPSVF